MYKLVFLLLASVSLGGTVPLAALGQSISPSVDTAHAHARTFGLTASPQLDNLFTANRSLPIGLLYTRQLTPAKSLRLRLVGLLAYADSSNFVDDIIGITNSYVTGPSYRRWQLQVFAGYAWQRPLSRRFSLDYGLEVGLGYQRQGFSSSRRYPYPPGGFVVDYDERTTQDWQVQVRPFAGISYRLTARLRLFAETALPITYTRQHWERHVRGTFTKLDEVDRFLDERAQTNRVASSWRPIQLLGVSYAF